MSQQKPHSPACEKNRAPILAVLKRYLTNTKSLLEIGSGTGQHAVYFAPEFPHLTWQTSDVAANHPGIQAWLTETPGDNIRSPLALDVLQDAWPDTHYDVVFSANTAHIMHKPAVEAMFVGVSRVLAANGLFILYGPFNMNGQFTAPSNQQFDRMLKMNDPGMGVRDIAWLQALADQHGLGQHEMIDMPANNKMLVWFK